MTNCNKIDSFLPKLQCVKPTKDGHSARCPAHEDGRASLSISTGKDGRVLVKCHAGCKTPDVMAAVGMTMADLAPPSPVQAHRKPTIVATYDYRDEQKVLLYQVVRMEPKDFRQRKPKSGGGWEWSVKEVRMVPYRLPDLLAADPGEAVFIPEGEKDCDCLAKLGLTATTNAGGAGKWRNEYTEHLRGRHAVILVDKDDPGEKHAQRVAAALKDVAASVRVLRLPGLQAKGDVSDWLNTGGTKVELLRLSGEAPVWTPSPTGGTANGELWPNPQQLPGDMPAVDGFSFDLLTGTLRPWIHDIAERMQCPPDFPAVAAMIGLAALLGRKVGIRPKRMDDWLVVPNLWGAVIGRPSLMKTPAMEQPLRPLKRLEAEAKEEFKLAEKEYLALEMVAEASRKHAQKDILATAVENKARAMELARNAIESETDSPVRQRFVVNDSTVEKLGVILAENPNGVLVFRDELTGLLRSLDRDGQESARAFYLEAWNGNASFAYDRIGRGTLDIECAIVSILGGIQPGPLRQYLRDAMHGGKGDDGLLQRFQLAVWPDDPGEWRNIDRWPDSQARNAAHDVYSRVHKLQAADVLAETDSHDAGGIPFLRFEAGAQDCFDAWRTDLEAQLRSGADHPAVEAHFAKYRSLIPTLALILHIAEGATGPAALSSLEKAIRWGTYLQSHARRIYATAATPDIAAARFLAKKIANGTVRDGFALRDIYRNGWTGLQRQDDADAAAKVLIDLHWLRMERTPTDGREATTFRINPRVRNSPATPPTKPTKPTEANSFVPSGGIVGSDSPSPGQSGDFNEMEPDGEEVAEWVA